MSTLTFLIIMFFTLVLGALAMMFLIMQKKTHRLVAKQKGKDHSTTRIYWMKEFTEKDGVTWWQSWPFPDIKVIAPQSESVDHQPNGRKIASGYLIGRDEVIWLTSNLQGDAKKAVEEGTGLALTPAQKMALINQIKKAESERQAKKSIGEIVLAVAPTLILAIVLILIVVSATDIASAINSINDKTVGIADRLLETGRLCETGRASANPVTVPSSTGTTVIPSTEEKPPVA